MSTFTENTIEDFHLKDFCENGIENYLSEVEVNAFILHLYHENVFGITNNFLSLSSKVFVSTLIEYWKDKNIKAKLLENTEFYNFLKRCKLITNSAEMPEVITISLDSLLSYEKSVLDQMDQLQIEKTLSQHVSNLEQCPLKTTFNSIKQKLQFKTCVKSEIPSLSEANKMLCSICLKDFTSNQLFEEHVESHNSISDFHWIHENKGSAFERFQIYCQGSDDSRFFKFTVTTGYLEMTINKIITVRSKDIVVLSSGKDRDIKMDDLESHEFIIDKHVFSTSAEQAIYIIFTYSFEYDARFIEVHLLRPIICLPRREIQENLIVKSQLKVKKGNLPDYSPRELLKELYKSGEVITENDLFSINDRFRQFCLEEGKVLKRSSISNILTFLLEMEEIETEIFYQKLTQINTKINFARRAGKKLEYSFKMILPDNLLMQNLINCGDEVILRSNPDDLFDSEANCSLNSKKIKNKYFGNISYIYGSNVYFECQNRDKLNDRITYNIEFRHNRRNFINQYAALSTLDFSLLSSFLFPENKIFEPPASLELNIVDNSVRNNPEQTEAVMNIVDGIQSFLPYIIVGPPGTGKTTTIVESILQLQIKNPDSRILVTAGSNAACDEIAKRLVNKINSNFPNIKILRLYSKSAEKSYDNIDEMLLNASNLNNGHHYYPSLESINRYNVVICTLSLVGRLKTSGMAPDSYSHCFIDECAASTEPEALVTIESVFHSTVNIIIAGDPKQLGPILQSNRAAEYGLKYSLLERLLNRECYRINSDKAYNRRIQTRLIRNFRSHPDILTISNYLFYTNDLLPCAPKCLTYFATNWCKLPQAEIPLVFHSVQGYTKQDKYSTSLFNENEIKVVLDYVKRLMFFKVNGKKINEEDIGVISPYKKQCSLIKEELIKRNWYKIATGSVETFQGQEKPIIIISAVRSIFSERDGVGFLVNEKRLNVMLTRAQGLLIIVGNKECLESVPNWKECIEYVQKINVLVESSESYDKNDERVPSELFDSFQQVNINS